MENEHYNDIDIVDTVEDENDINEKGKTMTKTIVDMRMKNTSVM